MDPKLEVERTKEIETAMRVWSKMMNEALAQRFGQGKVGHIVVLFPFGEKAKISWISDATRGSVINVLKELAKHLEETEVRIIRPQ